MPEVSVIIPTYNRAELLRQAIQSVLVQTYQDFEIIVVDDGSIDDTRQVVENLANPKIRYIYQKNRGVSAAYNTGIKNALGNMVAFLDSDDLWLPQKLEVQIKALNAAPWASVVYSDISFFGSGNGSMPTTYFRSLKGLPPRGKVLDSFIERCFTQTSTLLFKKQVFDQSGIFDENISHCEDYDLLFRIAEKFEFEVVDLPLAMYRTHGIQLSKEGGKMLAGRIKFLNKAIHSNYIDNKNCKRLRAKLSDDHFNYAIILLRNGKLYGCFKELLESVKTDAGALFPSSFSLLKQTLNRSYKNMNDKALMSNKDAFLGMISFMCLFSGL